MSKRLIVPTHDQLVAVAKDWAEGRKPPVLILHLYVMLVQLSVAVAAVAKAAGIELPDRDRPAFMPPDEVLAGFLHDDTTEQPSSASSGEQ